MRTFSREAAARLFLARQQLDRPMSRALDARSLANFVAGTGGLQLDSINVVARAHELTLWSRFGPYDRAALDRLVYGGRALFEYWAHAACLIAEEDRPAWTRAMADYRRRHTGWSGWLKAHPRVLSRVEGEIRARGPLSSSDFERPAARGKSAGWWDWKPAHHA
ncbi:MAG: winged helix DNA-binding domain-containing protein, partial [Elusimicrobia bacterium]|nr:winged helix DNA-binding domain-containing protein [Elusimicrobiota bacterium]